MVSLLFVWITKTPPYFPTQNLSNIYNLISKTFNTLNLTVEDQFRLREMGIESYRCPVYRQSYTLGTKIYYTRNNYLLKTNGNAFREAFGFPIDPYFELWATLINFSLAEAFCNFEIIDNTGTVSTIEEWRVDIFSDYWLPCAKKGTNLLSLWTNRICRGGEDGGIHGETGMQIRYDDGVRGVYVNGRVLETETVAKIPVIFPKEDISKYSNFEIRRRAIPNTFSNKEFILETLHKK